MAENDAALFYLGSAGADGYRDTNVRLVDALFRHIAQQIVEERGEDLSVEEVTDWSWEMFELGQIRLVIGKDDKPSLGYEQCSDEGEQREAARQNRRLVLARRRMQRGQPAKTPPYQRLLQRALT